MQTAYDSQLKRKLTFTMLISAFVIFSFYSFALVPLSIKTSTDVTFMIPVLADLIPYLKYLAEIAGMLIVYAFILFAAWRLDTNTVRLYAMLYMVLILYEYLTSLLMGYVFAGAFPGVADLLFDLMYQVALPVLIVYAVHAVILIIIYLIFKKVKGFVKSKTARSGKPPGFTFDEKALFFPIKKLFNRENPLQRSAFYISALFALNQIINLLITDIRIGPPADAAELAWMIISYLSCFMLWFGAYLFIIYILISLNNKDIRMKYSS